MLDNAVISVSLEDYRKIKMAILDKDEKYAYELLKEILKKMEYVMSEQGKLKSHI